MAGARTIEIFLPDGEPTGVKVAHIRNRNVEATYIPRAMLNDLKYRESLQGVGVYLLVGESEHHTKPMVYIGEAEIAFSRLQQHNASKDFWNYAIVITSNNKHLTKTHVKFLEWLCHNKAANANRCVLENGNVPNKPHAPESTAADLYDNFESIDLLLSTLGLNILQPLFTKPIVTGQNSVELQSNDKSADLTFRIKGKNADAQGKYTQEGFVVFANARCSKPYDENKYWYPKVRDQLIADDILRKDAEGYVLTQDHLFTSPSAAAAVVLGRNTNGWDSWKTEDGRSLHDVYRKILE